MKSLYKYRIVTYNNNPNIYILQKKAYLLRYIEQKIHEPLDYVEDADILFCIIAFIPFIGFLIIGAIFLGWFSVEIKFGWNDLAESDCPLKLEQKVSRHKQEHHLTYPDTYKIYLKL